MNVPRKSQKYDTKRLSKMFADNVFHLFCGKIGNLAITLSASSDYYYYHYYHF